METDCKSLFLLVNNYFFFSSRLCLTGFPHLNFPVYPRIICSLYTCNINRRESWLLCVAFLEGFSLGIPHIAFLPQELIFIACAQKAPNILVLNHYKSKLSPIKQAIVFSSTYLQTFSTTEIKKCLKCSKALMKMLI